MNGLLVGSLYQSKGNSMSTWDFNTIKEHEGYVGIFPSVDAEGAMPRDTEIIKVLSEPGDGHKIGESGKVLGSLPLPTDMGLDSKYMYWVEWNDAPKRAVAVVSKKIAKKVSP
jgi:hypothetical protein